jgi:DNA invertase Pin-like site-specific DNA recombinase
MPRHSKDTVAVVGIDSISGAKGGDQRSGINAMLKDANRRKFDVVMAWAIDRLGRSLIDLLGTIQHLEAVGVALYLDQQNIDTTARRRQAAVSRSRAPLASLSGHDPPASAGWVERHQGEARQQRQIHQQGRQVRRKLGRPGAESDKIERARQELAKGIGICKVAREVGLGVGTAHRLKREIGTMPPIDVELSANATDWPKDGQIGGAATLGPQKKPGKFRPSAFVPRVTQHNSQASPRRAPIDLNQVPDARAVHAE